MSSPYITQAFAAMHFARECHKDQRRKYTNGPYADHLAEVAGIVATVNASQVVLATAWLHDSMEDQGVTFEELTRLFGGDVAEGVRWLSDMEEGNRAERKRLSRERLARAPAWVQSVKCADIISNTSSIVLYDPRFAVTYLEEKRLLLDVLIDADPHLLAMARQLAETEVRV